MKPSNERLCRWETVECELKVYWHRACAECENLPRKIKPTKRVATLTKFFSVRTSLLSDITPVFFFFFDNAIQFSTLFIFLLSFPSFSSLQVFLSAIKKPVLPRHANDEMIDTSVYQVSKNITKELIIIFTFSTIIQQRRYVMYIDFDGRFEKCFF